MTLEQFKWRGTHVELPKNSNVVLMYGPTLVGVDEKHVTFGWCDSEGVWRDFHGLVIAGVTDWAELPMGPKARP